MSFASSGSSDELQRLARHKRRSNEVGVALGPEMISFFKHAVEKRHTKLSKIAECWGRVVPELLNDANMNTLVEISGIRFTEEAIG